MASRGRAPVASTFTAPVNVGHRKSNVTLDTGKFEAALVSTLAAMDRSSEAALEDFGAAAAAAIRDRAPAARGELRRGVGHEVGRDALGAYVDVYVMPFYATFVEWGTSRVKARPFFRPGLEAAAQKFTSFLDRLLVRL